MASKLAAHLRSVMVPLLSSFYFGSVEHYRLMANHPTVTIDAGEHYVRQSYRTRTAIIGPNGRQDPSVPVMHGGGRKLPMHEVRLCYEETWPQQHLHAIRSAYGKTPWFIHYYDDIHDTLLRKHERLLDLQLETLALGRKWLRLETEVRITEDYVEASDAVIDLRTTFHPKRPLPSGIEAVPAYPQVFADRHGFVPRLSIIDLMMNTGPEARRYLLAPS